MQDWIHFQEGFYFLHSYFRLVYSRYVMRKNTSKRSASPTRKKGRNQILFFAVPLFILSCVTAVLVVFQQSSQEYRSNAQVVQGGAVMSGSGGVVQGGSVMVGSGNVVQGGSTMGGSNTVTQGGVSVNCDTNNCHVTCTNCSLVKIGNNTCNITACQNGACSYGCQNGVCSGISCSGNLCFANQGGGNQAGLSISCNGSTCTVDCKSSSCQMLEVTGGACKTTPCQGGVCHVACQGGNCPGISCQGNTCLINTSNNSTVSTPIPTISAPKINGHNWFKWYHKH